MMTTDGEMAMSVRELRAWQDGRRNEAGYNAEDGQSEMHRGKGGGGVIVDEPITFSSGSLELELFHVQILTQALVFVA